MRPGSSPITVLKKRLFTLTTFREQGKSCTIQNLERLSSGLKMRPLYRLRISIKLLACLASYIEMPDCQNSVLLPVRRVKCCLYFILKLSYEVVQPNSSLKILSSLAESSYCLWIGHIERTLDLENILKCGWHDIVFIVTISNLGKKLSSVLSCRTLRQTRNKWNRTTTHLSSLNTLRGQNSMSNPYDCPCCRQSISVFISLWMKGLEIDINHQTTLIEI